MYMRWVDRSAAPAEPSQRVSCRCARGTDPHADVLS